MAPGANFTLTPNLVETLSPIYNNVITQSESMKKEFLNLSATPVERYKLVFTMLLTTDWDILVAHWKDNSAGYYPFSWQSVPSYIGGGANISGRWVPDSLSMGSVINGTCWNATVTFEKSV